ncbi:MAG: hypothetical protein PHQ23_06160 [Candidatus Wallbacteria bacterium]|nr:hypothetical protein [Candidatus Wallbacteria bacterium]
MWKKLYLFFTRALRCPVTAPEPVLLLVPLIILAFSSPVSALDSTMAGKKVVVLGDYVEYNTHTQDVVVKGRARAFNSDMNITADTLQANIGENRIFAYSNVIFWDKTDKNTGDFIYYNMKTGEGYLEKATVYRGAQIIRAGRLDFSPTYLEAKDLEFSTCEHLETSHEDYKISAGYLFIKRGEYMEIKDMKVWFQDKVIRNQKYQYQDLRETPRLFRQRLGYSRYNGAYGNITLPYNIRDIRKGTANLNFYQERGTGLALNESLSFSKDQSITYSYSYFGDTKNDTVDHKMNFSYSPRGANISGNVRAAYSSLALASGEPNQELNLNADASGKLAWLGRTFNASASLVNRIDIDGDNYRGDDYYSLLEKLPEIQVTLPQQKLKLFSTNMDQRLMLARYHQSGYSSFRGNKYSLTNALNLTPFKGVKYFPFTIRVNEDVLFNYYSSGEFMQVNSLRLQADQSKGKLRSSMRYEKKNVLGDSSPFRFDNESEREYFFFSTDLNMKNVTLKLFSTTYDFDRKLFGGAYSDLRISSEQGRSNKWTLYLKTDYDLGDSKIEDTPRLDTKLKSIYSQYTLRPEDTFNRFGLTFSARYDADKKVMQDFNGTMNFVLKPLTRKAHLTLNTRYDYTRNQFTTMKYDLDYDLHCFDSKLSYNTQDKDVWLEFSLKASPQKPTKLFYDYDKKKLKPIMRRYDI